jgi:hypothetical protein
MPNGKSNVNLLESNENNGKCENEKKVINLISKIVVVTFKVDEEHDS